MRYFKNFLLLLLGMHLFANDIETIIPDRPGFSTGTYTIQPGKASLELGYEYSFKNDVNRHTLPLLVFRTGITPDLEFDFMWDGIAFDRRSSSYEKSWNDSVTVGAKYRLVENSEYNFSFLGLFTLPTGNDFKKENIGLTGGLLWDYIYSNNISIFGTIQTSSYQENDIHVNDIQIAIGSSFAYDEKFSTFIEVYTIVPYKGSSQNEEVIDSGIMYLISSNIQLDINFGIGLNSISSHFVGAGLAIQF